jgi:hypothetical protein
VSYGPFPTKGMATARIDDRDKLFVEDFYNSLSAGLDKVPLSVFLCGKGLSGTPAGRRDIRTYLQGMLQAEIKSCRVKLGEHKVLIRTYKKAVGTKATNLADHEWELANRIDLLVIFPTSPGSIAELGMFCLEETIAQKMAIFLSARHKGSESFVINGPVAAAKRRNSKVYYVDYGNRTRIWRVIRNLVLDIRANKGRTRLLRP